MIQLEKKEGTKAVLASPRLGDTLAMSFVANVNPRTRDRKEWWEEFARYRSRNPSPDGWMA
jgi:hypothetical protein